MKKNICFINSYACIGGAEKSLQSIILGLRRKGYAIFVLLGEDGPFKQWLINEGIETKIIKQPSLKKGVSKVLFPLHLLRFIIQTWIYLKRNNIEIVHTNTLRSRVYSIFLRPFIKVKMVSHVRDIEPIKLNNILIKKYDATIAISQAVKTSLLKYNKNDAKLNGKVHVIYNAVDKPDVLTMEKSSDHFAIGMFARFDEWKCQHIFVKSAINLYRKYPNFIFYIYGDAIRVSEKNYKNVVTELIKEHQAKNYIHLVGFVEKPVSEMNKMDLIICPSDNEPFGRVIIEAMSLKKMIIASNNGGIPEILTDKLSILTVPPRDENALAEKIEEYYLSKKGWDEELLPVLYDEYQTRFSINQLISNIEKIYSN